MRRSKITLGFFYLFQATRSPLPNHPKGYHYGVVGQGGAGGLGLTFHSKPLLTFIVFRGIAPQGLPAVKVNPAFGFVLTPPTPGAGLFAGPRRRRAGRAAD